MKNKIEDLRNHLFESIELLKEEKMDIQTAASIADLARVIIDSARAENEFLQIADEKSQGTGFISINPVKQLNGATSK